MSILSCVSPLTISQGKEDIQVRCRKCPGCLRQRQYEWKNRMMLECWGLNFRPLFVTWTFDKSSYFDNKLYVLKETQKLYKKLRRLGHDIRYFTSIERGKKRGRLHAHSIIWSKSLAEMTWTDTFWTLLNTWQNGGIKLRVVNSAGAFHYTAKYIIKDLVKETDYLTGELKNGRNYTFSNRPGLGTNGINRWRELIETMFHVEHVTPNWFNMPMFGKLEKAYIPSDVYKRHVKALNRDHTVSDLDLESDLISQQISLETKYSNIPVTEWVDQHIGIMDSG